MDGIATFQKPPVVCNDLCDNYNCTYTFYTEENCTSGKAVPYKTMTLYPKGCYDDVCQRDAATEERCASDPNLQPCRETSDLIVRGWGTYFELDHDYKSVRFNGYGNCGFFLYEGQSFTGKTGHFRGYYAGHSPDRPWNAPSNASTLCRNINLTYFNGHTGSLETNDTCWLNAKRKSQSDLP